MADRYFAPDLDPLALDYVLEGPELHHFRTVCRGKLGHSLELFDGKGQSAEASVLDLSRHSATLKIVSRKIQTRPITGLVVAAALPKGDRGTFLVEKLTELGTRELLPLQTTRSVTEPREGKLARFERTIVEACKQSGRSYLMELGKLTTWPELAATTASPRWLLDPRGEEWDARNLEAPALVAIGPEGGWTPEEIDLARNSGWRVLRLPGDILRVETAAITIAAFAAMTAPRPSGR